ncbi:hypothetical protein Agub_g9474 [Astrephomene gubernaculifera]|uniref:Protein kinase domain-containing protein n=1 Tax=Astrephomene gubernaculifera TaxID=47775 RepID=A0AAD3HPB9_9CHLO|nr:hypothetical protein Agub_g9474 [Astrephomene gubernaculifera]
MAHDHLMRRLRRFLLGALLAWGLLAFYPTQAGAQAVNASTPEELRRALLNGATEVALLNNMNFTPENWPEPVLITRATTIYSPYRVKLDFCGSNGGPARVLLNVTSTGSLLLQRVFLRNFLPSGPQDLSGLGPVPALLSSGGLISFRIVVFHFLPAVTWVFSAPPNQSFWAAQTAASTTQQPQQQILTDVYTGAGLQLARPSLYVASYTSSLYSIALCYSPVDLHACYADNREDTQLAYCLYSFADSLRNPHVRYVRVFHDIGVDRVAYNRFNPIPVTTPKSLSACPGTLPSINLDKVLNGVSVRAALEFNGFRFKSSRPTNFTTWPPALPVLLSLMDVDGPGSVALTNCTIEVPQLGDVVTTLKALPGCCSMEPSRPNLQPTLAAWPSGGVLAAAAAVAAANASLEGGVIVDSWPWGDGSVEGSTSSGGAGVTIVSVNATPLTLTASLPAAASSFYWKNVTAIPFRNVSSNSSYPSWNASSNSSYPSWNVSSNSSNSSWNAVYISSSSVESATEATTAVTTAATVSEFISPRPGFTINSWVLPKNSWLQYSAVSLYDIISQPSSASWSFSAVRVEQAAVANDRSLCFGAALEQGSTRRPPIARVGNDTQLRQALASGVRYIQVVDDIKLDPQNWPAGGGALQLDAGIIEVRGCHPAPDRRFTLDLSDLTQPVVRCSGRLLLQGDLRLVNPGWVGAEEAGEAGMWLLGAFAVVANRGGGAGSVELEDVLVEAQLNASGPGLRPSDLLTALNLGGGITADMRARNVSLYGSCGVTLGLWAVPAPAPQTGTWAFTHTLVRWAADSNPDASNNTSSSGGGEGEGGGKGGLSHRQVLSIALPVGLVGGGLLLAAAAAGAVLYGNGNSNRRTQGEAAAAAVKACGSGGGSGGGGGVLKSHPSSLLGALLFRALWSHQRSGGGGSGGCGGEGDQEAGLGTAAAAEVGMLAVSAAAPVVVVGTAPGKKGAHLHHNINNKNKNNGGGVYNVSSGDDDSVSDAMPGVGSGGGGGPATAAAAALSHVRDAGRYDDVMVRQRAGDGGGGGGGGVASEATGAGGGGGGGSRGDLFDSGTRERGLAGPLGDIDAARRALTAGRMTPDEEPHSALGDLVLQSVLGEGSYGRVYRALWRGTTVAVKVILLPAHMSGRERLERMAVMEAAISSSLSHPNIVQTYTYSVAAVEGPKARAWSAMQSSGHTSTALPGSSHAPLDPTAAGGAGAGGGLLPSGLHAGAPGGTSAGEGMHPSDIAGWEIRLVQEYCDLGSLRDKLDARAFFRPAAAAATAAAAAAVPVAGAGGAASSAPSGAVAASTNTTNTAAVLQPPRSFDSDQQPPRQPQPPQLPVPHLEIQLQPLQPLHSYQPSTSPSAATATTTATVTPAAAASTTGGSEWGSDLAGAAAAGNPNSGSASGGASSPAVSYVVDLAAVLDTAIDVARALAHLHRQGIVHADLKPRNVLLKGSTTDPRGFVAKVADFGLSMQLDVHETHVSNAYHGTLAYMAPETLIQGHVSRASDVYGFGILLYELYTGETAFQGIPKALVGHAITKDNLRPSFPPALAAPFEYQLLACRCWESNPEIRPEFDFILEDLKRMRLRLGCSLQQQQQQLGNRGGNGVNSNSGAAADGGGCGGVAGAAGSSRRTRVMCGGGGDLWGLPHLLHPAAFQQGFTHAGGALLGGGGGMMGRGGGFAAGGVYGHGGVYDDDEDSRTASSSSSRSSRGCSGSSSSSSGSDGSETMSEMSVMAGAGPQQQP